MVRQASKSILSTFNLAESLKRKVVDKPTVRRNKLLAKLDEQILAVQAALNGEEYFGKKNVREHKIPGANLKKLRRNLHFRHLLFH